MWRARRHHADELGECEPLLPHDQFDRRPFGLGLDGTITADTPGDRTFSRHYGSNRTFIAEREQNIAILRNLDEIAPDRIDDIHQRTTARPATDGTRDRNFAFPFW